MRACFGFALAERVRTTCDRTRNSYVSGSNALEDL